MRAPDWPSWKNAIESEMESQRKNGTFKKVVRTSGMKVIGSRLVFKKKMKNGIVERYKVRWVAQGFRQIQGIDYFETFAPTVKPASLRVSLAIAVLFGLKVVTLDVVTAFLIPSLPDDQVIYIEPPPFMGLPKNVVLRLCKALYGIRQAANLWFKHLKLSMQACRSVSVHERRSAGGPRRCRGPRGRFHHCCARRSR
jgi:hypothetical protein